MAKSYWKTLLEEKTVIVACFVCTFWRHYKNYFYYVEYQDLEEDNEFRVYYKESIQTSLLSIQIDKYETWLVSVLELKFVIR